MTSLSAPYRCIRNRLFALNFKRESDRNDVESAYLWPAEGFVAVDLKYTSWEGSLERGWSRPHEHREVVQIGAVRLDAGNGFAEVDALDVLVRPQRNPVLSEYFVALTGITMPGWRPTALI